MAHNKISETQQKKPSVKKTLQKFAFDFLFENWFVCSFRVVRGFVIYFNIFCRVLACVYLSLSHTLAAQTINLKSLNSSCNSRVSFFHSRLRKNEWYSMRQQKRLGKFHRFQADSAMANFMYFLFIFLVNWRASYTFRTFSEHFCEGQNIGLSIRAYGAASVSVCVLRNKQIGVQTGICANS